MSIKKYIFLFFIMTTVLCFAAAEQPEEVIFFGFENESEIWDSSKTTENNGVKKPEISSEKFLQGKHSLKLQVNFPGEVSIEKEFFKNLSKYKNLTLNIYVNEDCPDDLKILVFLQDSEWLWYQTSLFHLQKNKWNKLSLNVQPDSPVWENIGHNQPWSSKSASNIKKIGLKIFSQSSYYGSLFIDDIRGELMSFPEYSISSKEVKRYEKIEISFNLLENYSNPFDPEEIKVDGFFLPRTENNSLSPAFTTRNTGGN